MPYPKCSDPQRGFFREHGWLVVEDAIDAEVLALARGRTQAILDHKEKLAFDWAWEKGVARENRAFKIVQGSPTMVWPEIAETLFRRWMLEFGGALMGRPVCFWYDQLLAKPPREGAPTYWHQARATGGATSTIAASPAGCRSRTSRLSDRAGLGHVPPR